MQLLSGICLSALLSSAVIYIVETSLASQRGSALCFLFAATFLSAQSSSLLVRAYRTVVLSLFGGGGGRGVIVSLGTKLAVSVAYSLIFIVLPLGLCLSLGS